MEFRYRAWFPNKVLPKSLTSTQRPSKIYCPCLESFKLCPALFSLWAGWLYPAYYIIISNWNSRSPRYGMGFHGFGTMTLTFLCLSILMMNWGSSAPPLILCAKNFWNQIRNCGGRQKNGKRLNAAFSHDLRNPITVLKGTIKLLRQGTADEQAIDRLESYTLRIEQYAEAMSSIQRLEQMPVADKRLFLFTATFWIRGNSKNSCRSIRTVCFRTW